MRRIHGRAALGAALALALSAVSSAQTTQQQPSRAWTRYSLANGLDVVLEERHETPRVAVEVDYNVGTRDQIPGYSGLAHLTEHLMFTWARARPDGDAGQFLSSVGTEHLIGITTSDTTRYAEVVSSSMLERVIAFESDRMGFLLDHIDQRKLEAQRLIIGREREERYLAWGSRTSAALLYQTLYGAEHPYRSMVEDPVEASALSLDHVRWFHQRWYTPSNATLVIVGDFETPRVRAWIERYFGSLARVARPQRSGAERPTLDREHTVVAQGNRLTDRVAVTWHTPPYFAEDDAELDTIADLLTGTSVSRLRRRVEIEREIALATNARQDSSELASRFSVFATVRDQQFGEAVLPHVDAEIARLRTELISEEELRTAKARRTLALRVFQASLEGRAAMLAECARLGGALDQRELEWSARYERVTPRSIRRAARRWLQPTQRVVSILRSTQHARAVTITPAVER